MIVLVIGGGGREHALCYALKRSPSCDAVFCAPGNAGISSSGDATCISDLDILDSSAVISFCRKWGVGMVVVGPEAPLVAGLANDLVKAGIPTFGPSSEAAALEGSKNFMKSICDKYGIPTAKVCALNYFLVDLHKVILLPLTMMRACENLHFPCSGFLTEGPCHSYCTEVGVMITGRPFPHPFS